MPKQTKNHNLTPRGYLSWSQLNLWESSPERYKKVYLYGEKLPINKGQAFGAKMADGLEDDEATVDPLLDAVMTRIPKFETMEREIRTIIKAGDETIPLLAKIDTAKKNLSGFKEYKTGQTRWTQGQVDKSGQIDFYAMAIYAKTGKIPWDIELVHIETKAAPDGRIAATGQIFRHPTVRTMNQILNMMVRAKRSWVGIKQLSEEELL
jgi:hypothetical protein